LTGIHHFALGTRHVGFVAAVRTGHAVGTLTDGGTVTVHGGITTTQHHHFFTRHADKVRRVFFKTQVVVDVGNQKIQRIHHTRQVFTGEAAFHVGVGAHAEESGVEFFDQAVEIDVFAYFGTQAELNTHAFKDSAAIGHHTLFQLELGNTEGEQTTDFRVFIEYHRGDAVAHQYVGTAQASRAGTDNGHAFAGRHHFRHIRLPAHGKGGIGNVFLNVTNSDCTEAVVEGTGTLTQTVLRAHPAAHFRQGVGLVAQFYGFQNVAFAGQFQPVRNKVVNRAFPFAVRVATAQATVCLLVHFFLIERLINFHKLAFTQLEGFFGRIFPAHIQKLEVIVQTLCHLEPLSLIPTGYSGRARVLFSNCCKSAAFGFTSQNLPT